MSAVYWAVLRAAMMVGGLSAVVKVAAVLKEGLVAYQVGTAPELDAFLLAYAFPAFLVNAVTGPLGVAFVPAYARVREAEGEGAAADLAQRLSWRLAIILLVATIVAAPVCSVLIWFVASAFDEATIALAMTMTLALMPVLFLNGLSGFWSGFLNARRRFAVAAIAPIATPLCVAGALVLFWEDTGIQALVFGTLAGGMVEMAVVAFAARADGLPLFTLPARPGPNAERILPEFFSAAGGNVLIGATLLVDQAMAAMLAPGSVAALNYGTRFTAAVVGIGTMALATALLPHLSELIAQRHFRELRQLLGRYALLTLAVAVPVTILLVAYSEPIIALLFERGSFNAADSALVADVQSAYALQIPFYASAMIAVRLISAMQVNRILMIGAGMSLVLDVVLNWILSAWIGVAGIALATSIVYAVACGYLWTMAMTHLRRISP